MYMKCLGHEWHCIGIKLRALNPETSRAKVNKQIQKLFAVATRSFTRLGDHYTQKHPIRYDLI